MKNVFLTGAQGVGKTTLVYEVAEQLHLNPMTDMSKMFLTEKTKHVQSAYGTKEFLEFQQKIFLWCAREYVFSTDTAFSRSFIDSYAYISHALQNTALEHKDHLTSLHRLIDEIYTFIPFTKEDLYVYVPIEFEISSDGNSLRSTDSYFQKDIDERIRQFLSEKMRIPYITVTGSVKDRVAQIKEAYDSLSV